MLVHRPLSYQVISVNTEGLVAVEKKVINMVNVMSKIAVRLPALNSSLVISPDIINTYFQIINTDDEYEAPTRLRIPAGTRLPTVNECDALIAAETNRLGV